MPKRSNNNNRQADSIDRNDCGFFPSLQPSELYSPYHQDEAVICPSVAHRSGESSCDPSSLPTTASRYCSISGDVEAPGLIDNCCDAFERALLHIVPDDDDDACSLSGCFHCCSKSGRDLDDDSVFLIERDDDDTGEDVAATWSAVHQINGNNNDHVSINPVSEGETAEQSSSMVDENVKVEHWMRRRLVYFFMTPIQKYRAKGRIPWKMFTQALKVFIITLQVSGKTPPLHSADCDGFYWHLLSFC